MLRYGLLSVPLIVAVSVGFADAGIFRKSKGNPTEVVPQLVKTLQSDPEDGKRLAAAEELREYDPKTFPEIIPALINALGKDASYSVRSEAAQTIGKLRPVSQQAGFALEQALDNDSSLRVRMSARSSLWQYTLLGYRGAKPDEPQQEQTGEPPLAPPQAAPKANAVPKSNGPPVGKTLVVPSANAPRQPTQVTIPTPASRTQTQEPPLAAPLVAPPVVKPVPRFAPAPADEEGPSLSPPLK